MVLSFPSVGTSASGPAHPSRVTGPGAQACTESITTTPADSSVDHALARASSAGYDQWLGHVVHVGECTHPIRLAGHVDTVDAATGQVLDRHSTDAMPDAALYTACGNRRAAVCPACSAIYRADTYQLVAAGMNGGKGVPETVTTHPTLFLTLTAPSFGPVHSQRPTRKVGHKPQAQVCRPGRRPRICRHGVDHRCRLVHEDTDRRLGTPLCLRCYDHDAQVVFNSMAGELWRRTMATLAKRLKPLQVKASYAKVAEMQGRGVVHFHALIRFDHLEPGPEDQPRPPSPFVRLEHLRQLVTDTAASTAFVTPGHADQVAGWVIAWGEQLDLRTVRTGEVDEITDTAVAAYLAKYSTKGTESAGHVSARLTTATVVDYLDDATHVGRLIAACWHLGRPGAQLQDDAPARISFGRLRRWAHMLGFGGHFSTKSRRYSTTLGRLRAARTEWRRRPVIERTAEHHDLDDETILLVGSLTFAGIGWHTTGDALLASTAAAKAREYAAIGREELSSSTTGRMAESLPTAS